MKSVRVNISLSEKNVEMIDMYANEMGVSRSALCSTWINQALLSYRKSLSVLDDLGERLKAVLIEESENSNEE